jgi:hypothetical protein
MLTKLRLLSAAGMLVTLTSAGALAETISPAGTYMGTPLNPNPPVVNTQSHGEHAVQLLLAVRVREPVHQ